MKTERCMTQTKLAERWRTESGGPLFLKLGHQMRYRLEDVEAIEEAVLHGGRPSTMRKLIRVSQPEQTTGGLLGSTLPTKRLCLSLSGCVTDFEAPVFAPCLPAANADLA